MVSNSFQKSEPFQVPYGTFFFFSVEEQDHFSSTKIMFMSEWILRQRLTPYTSDLSQDISQSHLDKSIRSTKT